VVTKTRQFGEIKARLGVFAPKHKQIVRAELLLPGEPGYELSRQAIIDVRYPADERANRLAALLSAEVKTD
jgi:hypothetical protein